MEKDLLSPAVQDGGEADLCAEVVWVLGDRLEGLRAGSEEDVEEEQLVAEHEGVQLLRDREDDVEVGHGQQALLAGLEPLVFLEALALGTVPIPAGNGELSITSLMGSGSLWGVDKPGFP